jgi:hypothetical protein
MKEARIRISTTEMPHFRRLVAFVEEVDRHAGEECDLALQDLVRTVRVDLLHLMRGDDEGEA